MSKVAQAQWAEQAERYEEMVTFMKQHCKETDSPLSTEERNLLSVAYKNVVGAKRAAWRILTSLHEKNEEKGLDEESKVTKAYMNTVEDELEAVCNEVLDLLNDNLIPGVSSSTGNQEDVEAHIFYLKMAGDYCRYIAEFAQGEKNNDAKDKAERFYDQAMKCAQEHLKSTHPIRLGLALNFSVFYYEIQNKNNEACELAKGAFDDAIAELDSLNEESYKDATLIMQLLRDNLTLWTSDQENDAQ